VIGLGVNTGWEAAAFPADLVGSMTSLRAATGGPIDDDALLVEFVRRLEPSTTELRAGRFDAAAWTGRQVTTGRTVRLERPDCVEIVRAVGVDPATGGLRVAADAAPGGTRTVLVGEITHVRLADPVAGVV
jgi:hypothetical protein